MTDLLKKILVLGFVFLMTGSITSQSTQDYGPTNKVAFKILKEKLFFSLYLIETELGVSEVFGENDYFEKLKAYRLRMLHEGVATCGEHIDCHASKFIWSDEDIKNIGNNLRQLVKRNSDEFEKLAETLRSSGKYTGNNELNDSEFIQKSVVDALKAMNLIVETFALGQPPRYAKIDSIRYNKSTSFYKRLVDINVNSVSRNLDDTELFFQGSLHFALNLLADNRRLEAVSYEPLEVGENKNTVQHMKSIKWDDYEYSIILVPGYGPKIAGERLSPIGKYRLRLAAQRFHTKKAPLIVVSGSAVSPFGTSFNEAYEMKNELMANYGIPEKVILMEPHARHTTTNIRNTARLIFSSEIPNVKKVLLTTTKYQHDYILRDRFGDRCISELGYLPFSKMKTINANDIEFSPTRQSFQINSSEPLDP